MRFDLKLHLSQIRTCIAALGLTFLLATPLPAQPIAQNLVVQELTAGNSAAPSTGIPLPDNPAPQIDPQASAPTAPPPTAPPQTKRILGIMPNFSAVAADTKLPPQSARDKFLIAGRNSFDYSSFLIAGIQAGISMDANSYPEFHQGVKGYTRYYWHTLADTATENFMVSGVAPALFRQDNRFYTLGHGGFRKRALYAATRVLITRQDDGSSNFNYSEIVGSGAAAGASTLYYPTHYRTWTKVGQKWLTSDLIDSANFVFKEFWPDINKKIFHTH